MDIPKNDKNFHSKISFCTVLLTLFIFFPSTCQTNTENTTFSFSLANDLQHMKLDGDAYISGSVIELTRNNQDSSNSMFNGSVGGVTYGKPIHLWDNVTSKNIIADFTTHFSLFIDSTAGQGFAFFLAPVDSQLQYFSDGFDLGHLSSKKSSIKFAAVEFNTRNTGGGSGDYIGIYLSSKPVNTVDWKWNDVSSGGKIDAWIYFSSLSKSFSVDVSNTFAGSGEYSYNLSCSLDLTVLTEWVTVGFSAGTSTTTSDETQQISSWDFNSNLQLPENLTDYHNTSLVHQTASPMPPSSSRKRKNKVSLKLIIVIVVVAIVCLVLVISCLFLFLSNKRKSSQLINDELKKESGPTLFSYKELAEATNNFSNDNKLGYGGSGEVYRGSLNSGSVSIQVAVKRIKSEKSEAEKGKKEFESEVRSINKVRHRNLLELIGWCCEKKQLLLVYELMPNGSLDSHLKRKTGELTWERRYAIALGLASALRYLQEECRQYILHRDIKASNVLLDAEFSAKLGDFGIARIIEHGEGSSTTVLQGSRGYMAPEYVRSDKGKATKESDVYAFGKVALEIVSGKHAYLPIDEEQSLVEWICQKYRSGHVSAVADPILGQDYDEVQMKRLMIVGLACVQPDPNRRPPIADVILMLNGHKSLPEFQHLAFEIPLPPDVAAHRAIAFENSISSSMSANVGSETGHIQLSSVGSNTPASSSYFTATSNADEVPLLPSNMPVARDAAALQANAFHISPSSARVANGDSERGHTWPSSTAGSRK